MAQDLSFIRYFTTIMQLFLLTLAFSVTQCQDRCLIFANESPRVNGIQLVADINDTCEKAIHSVVVRCLHVRPSVRRKQNNVFSAVVTLDYDAKFCVHIRRHGGVARRHVIA